MKPGKKFVPGLTALMRSVDPQGHVSVPLRDPHCWVWLLAPNNTGYGQGSFEGQSMTAHQYAYTAFRGAVPEGLELDHLCRNRICCNPAHLDPVTRSENNRRRAKTHCKKGHPFGSYRNKQGHRRCLVCLSAYRRNARRQKARA